MNIQSSQHVQSQPLLDLDLLKTLVAIAETGNFSSAAERVFRTPSAVSMQVKKMEEIIGKPVFVRDSRSVTLTNDGVLLLEHARRVLALNNQIMANFISPDITGEIRIGAGDDFAERLLPGMLRQFNQTHPCVVVEVVMENSNELIAKIDEGTVDLAIVTCNAGYSADDRTEKLLTENLVWAMRKGGIAAEQRPLPISVWEEGCVWRKAAMDALEKAGIDYRVAFRSAYIGGQKAAVLSDLAISPLPVSSLGGDIVEASTQFEMPELQEYSLGMLVRSDPSETVKAAVEHLRASFATTRLDSNQ
ncbi:MAG: LysR family transcriptional regulator [Pseudomonadota bacterium]